MPWWPIGHGPIRPPRHFSMPGFSFAPGADFLPDRNDPVYSWFRQSIFTPPNIHPVIPRFQKIPSVKIAWSDDGGIFVPSPYLSDHHAPVSPPLHPAPRTGPGFRSRPWNRYVLTTAICSDETPYYRRSPVSSPVFPASRCLRMNDAARCMASLEARSSAKVRTFSGRKSNPRPAPG